MVQYGYMVYARVFTEPIDLEQHFFYYGSGVCWLKVDKNHITVDSYN